MSSTTSTSTSTATSTDPTSASARAQRRNATRAAAASGTSIATGNGDMDAREADAAAASMSEAKVFNLSETKHIGKLGLQMRGLPIRRIGTFQQEIYENWPDSLLFAAISDVTARGIDPEIVAKTWTISRRAYEPDSVEITVGDVARELSWLSNSLSTYSFTDAAANGKNHPLDVIAGHVWEMSKETPDLTLESLPLLIADNLLIEELADLLRAMLCVLGGFPGDLASRLFGL